MDASASAENGLVSLNLLNKDDYAKTFTTGKETIKGVEYDYEDFDSVKFCYSGDTLKYIKDSEYTIEVLECDNKAKTELFEIPTNYDITDESETESD